MITFLGLLNYIVKISLPFYIAVARRERVGGGVHTETIQIMIVIPEALPNIGYEK